MHGIKEAGLSSGANSSSVGKPFHPEEYTQYYRAIETTPKTKETKTMNTKKPGTSHGKPTAKGMKEALKPKAKEIPVEKIRAAAEAELEAIAKRKNPPKYPAPREALTYGVTITGKSTKESIIGLLEMTIEIHNGTLKDLAATGTKLDRALVDLKEAKAKIKALEAAK